MILFYHFLTVKKFIFPKKHIDFRQKTIAFAVFFKKNAQKELLNTQFEVSYKVPVEKEAPYQLQVINKGVKGELKLSFKLPDAARVTNNSIEYSLDNGQNWNNGIYTSRSSITLRDLPSRQSVLFRVRSMGTFERKSPWTEAVEGFVL
ncbi:MAG: hypothetical protein NW218_08225 [Saprospiraceae bacterium]|nr:hypothetical protein [Saprospiraceae bacterium]